MPIEHLRPTEKAARVAEVLARDGCAVVDRLVPRATLDRVRMELAPYLEATPIGPDAFSGRHTRRTLMGYARGAYALGYVDDLRDPIEVVRPGAGAEGFGDLPAAARKAIEEA